MVNPRLMRTPRRKSSTPHYQTFPTPPPRNKGRPLSYASHGSSNSRGHSRNGSRTSRHVDTPLPRKQLAVLAVIALCEQTALNSMSPYLPEMVSTFPEVDVRKVGLHVGMIASSFALAQFATNYFWGWLSDRVGRKPVILAGTLMTAVAFVAFGFCRTLWQAVLVQVFMGLVNGNQGVVSTCLGELTDRSNQSKAFTYLPVIYGIGGITGPVLGGLLSDKGFDAYPYLLPNLFSAVLLVVDLIVAMLFLEESLEDIRDQPPLGQRIGNLFAWVWQLASSTAPGPLRRQKKMTTPLLGDGRMDESGPDGDEVEGDDGSSDGAMPSLLPRLSGDTEAAKQIWNRNTILLLTTYLVFQLSNISYNSLYPIFGQAAPPTGRNLTPSEIGISLAFAGIATILFQIGLFGKLKERVGNKVSYRIGLAGFVLAFWITPFVGYKDADNGDGGMGNGQGWLFTELCVVLLVKTIASVGGLTSALLLITNSAPSPSVLGTLNGLAQTLSAGGRAVGPLVSGALFTLSFRIKPKGEVLAFGVFGGIALLGFLASFGIRGEQLESGGYEESGESSGTEDSEEQAGSGGESRSAA